MIKKTIGLLIALLGVCLLAKAQQGNPNNQFVLNKYSLSPAYAGYNANIETFIGYRNNWAGVEGAPESKLININGQVLEKNGLGLCFNMDNIGIFTDYHLAFNYAYHVKIKANQSLNLGMGMGYSENKLSYSGLGEEGRLDPYFDHAPSFSEKFFYFGAAGFYQWKALQVGFVLPSLLNQPIEGSKVGKGLMDGAANYMVHASYRFPLAYQLDYEPVLLYRQTAGFSPSVQFSNLIHLKERIWFGINYATGNIGTYGFMLGGGIFNNLVINYSYELAGYAGLSHASSSHELALGFLIGKNREKEFHGSAFPSSHDKPYYKWIE